MKKSISIPARLTSALLTLLLIAAMTANVGVIGAFAVTAKSSVMTEAELRESLASLSSVTLEGDIELTSCLEISGRVRTINTNGYSLSRAKHGSSGDGGVLRLTGGASLVIINERKASPSSLTGGNASAGGCVYVDGDSRLRMQNITVTANSAENGGGIYVKSGSAELTGCTLDNNTVAKNGGAIYVNTGASATLNDCTIELNAASDGGGIYNLGTLTVDGCTVTGNTAEGGAGVWSKGSAALLNSEISRNLNAIYGGGVTNHKDMTIRGCAITENHASDGGGAVYIDAVGETVVDSNSVISANTASSGAGIYAHKGNLAVSQTMFENNVAGEAGGGLWANSGTAVTIEGAEFQTNSCHTNGGGLNSHGSLIIRNSIVNACSAENCGGGVCMDSNAALNIEGSDITNCTSVKGGGGVYFYAGSLILAGGSTRIADSSTDGAADNIRFRNFRRIQITGAFAEGSEISFVPPVNSDNVDVTEGYGANNTLAPSAIFRFDTDEYIVNPNEDVKEVNLLPKPRAGYTAYHAVVNIKVTDDADWWDYANLSFYTRSNKGRGEEQLVYTTADFKESIDDDDEEYTFDFECGEDEFPSAVNFCTSFGSWGTWREFEADVKIYINEINCASQHVVHEVYGDEEKNTKISIGGNKYPYPLEFEVEKSEEIDPADASTKRVTVTATDQYGLALKAGGDGVRLENVSFPGEDTFEAADETGLSWIFDSTHTANHQSTYELTFLSGSNVYPEITKAINVQFVFPLTLRVVVKDQVVFTKKGYRGDRVAVTGITPPTGYHINGYKYDGVGITEKNSDGSYDFTFVNDSVTMTAKLKTNNYKIYFNKNDTPDTAKEFTGNMSLKATTYDTSIQLPSNKFKRKGYSFVGWNTQPDGMGASYADSAKVSNLASEQGASVTLYAIWKPEDASTTASIFSYDTNIIYLGAAALVIAVAAAVIYSLRKKRSQKTSQI